MRNREAVRYKDRLDHLFKQTREFSADPEIESEWAKYLCVLVSGFLEVSIRSIYSQYAQSQAGPNIVNYVETQLEDFQNPKMGKILELTGAFNSEWAQKLQNAAEGELKDAVDGIVNNRHKIAHGESVEITLVRVKEYYTKAVKVVEFVENLCSP